MAKPLTAHQNKVRKIGKLLIANRGEIAVRIERACRAGGDRFGFDICRAGSGRAPRARRRPSHLPWPGSAADTYLNIDAIIGAALSTGSDAIHPGYGFLSENADFAARCEEAGLIFIGPPSGVIRALGDKSAAKALAVLAGVPVVPGYYGADQSDERLIAAAAEVGVPLIVKATAGGGGRGMRVVHDLLDFHPLLTEARREARAAFGSDAILLEQYLDRPRHIEVQIFGDAQGQVFALHERECSLQRRHQKILEESPSPGLDGSLRAKICDAAVRIAQSAGYRNAGTVEFLLEESGGNSRYYFLEVNTRLQVEHPVTELRTALDLVRLQIQVAENRSTPGLNSHIPAVGHAIELRICSEDPARDFAPSIGVLSHWVEPAGPGIRVDSGVERGSEVTPYYDPMLAKLIVHAATRPEAIARLESALTEFQVLGVTTNIPYLQSIVQDAEFQAGRTHIRFIEDRFSEWHPGPTIPDEVLLALAVETLIFPRNVPSSTKLAGRDPMSSGSAWREAGSWRNV